MALKSKTPIFQILIGICAIISPVVNIFFKKWNLWVIFKLKFIKNITLKYNGYHTANNISLL